MNKPQITKSLFIDIFNELQEGQRIVKEVNQAFRSSYLNTDFCNASGMAIFHDGLVISILDMVLDTDMCEYFFYETDCGRRISHIEYDGKELSIANPSDLWDTIVFLKEYN